MREPRCHIDVSMVSPGNTGAEKRAWRHTRKSTLWYLHGLDARRVVVSKAAQGVANGISQAAQPMQDRLVKAAEGGHLGIDVQRVEVAREAVQRGLAGTGAVRLHGVWGPGRHRDSGLGSQQ